MCIIPKRLKSRNMSVFSMRQHRCTVLSLYRVVAPLIASVVVFFQCFCAAEDIQRKTSWLLLLRVLQLPTESTAPLYFRLLQTAIGVTCNLVLGLVTATNPQHKEQDFFP